MIDEDVLRMEDEEKRNLAYRGQTWQEHLKEEGVTEAQHRERQKPRAEERIKAGIVLGEIAEKEKIEVKPAEVEMRMQILKGQYQDSAMRGELDKPEAKRDIENRLLTEKTIAKLTELAAN
jgi:trigger factor